jgi:aminopeptidase N
MIEGYREIVGDATFYDFARTLTNDYAYGSISIDEFVAEAKAASGFSGAQLELLDGYFQQWLVGTTRPTTTPDSS